MGRKRLPDIMVTRTQCGWSHWQVPLALLLGRHSSPPLPTWTHLLP